MNYYLVSSIICKKEITDPDRDVLHKVFITPGESTEEVDFLADLYMRRLMGDIEYDDYFVSSSIEAVKRRTVVLLAYKFGIVSMDDLSEKDAFFAAEDCADEYASREEHNEAMGLVEAQLRFIDRWENEDNS